MSEARLEKGKGKQTLTGNSPTALHSVFFSFITVRPLIILARAPLPPTSVTTVSGEFFGSASERRYASVNRRTSGSLARRFSVVRIGAVGEEARYGA